MSFNRKILLFIYSAIFLLDFKCNVASGSSDLMNGCTGNSCKEIERHELHETEQQVRIESEKFETISESFQSDGEPQSDRMEMNSGDQREGVHHLHGVRLTKQNEAVEQARKNFLLRRSASAAASSDDVDGHEKEASEIGGDEHLPSPGDYGLVERNHAISGNDEVTQEVDKYGKRGAEEGEGEEEDDDDNEEEEDDDDDDQYEEEDNYEDEARHSSTAYTKDDGNSDLYDGLGISDDKLGIHTTGKYVSLDVRETLETSEVDAVTLTAKLNSEEAKPSAEHLEIGSWEQIPVMEEHKYSEIGFKNFQKISSTTADERLKSSLRSMSEIEATETDSSGSETFSGQDHVLKSQVPNLETEGVERGLKTTASSKQESDTYSSSSFTRADRILSPGRPEISANQLIDILSVNDEFKYIVDGHEKSAQPGNQPLKSLQNQQKPANSLLAGMVRKGSELYNRNTDVSVKHSEANAPANDGGKRQFVRMPDDLTRTEEVVMVGADVEHGTLHDVDHGSDRATENVDSRSNSEADRRISQPAPTMIANHATNIPIESTNNHNKVVVADQPFVSKKKKVPTATLR